MKSLKYTIILSFVIAAMIASCVNPPDYPIEPQIEFLSLTKDVMDQTNLLGDSTLLRFSFTDGDGDLGSDSTINAFVIDKRDGFEARKYVIPYIPPQGAANGISGEISFAVFSSCCIYEDNYPPCTVNPNQALDTLVYQVYIEDRAGNVSNTIDSAPIILRCN